MTFIQARMKALRMKIVFQSLCGEYGLLILPAIPLVTTLVALILIWASYIRNTDRIFNSANYESFRLYVDNKDSAKLLSSLNAEYGLSMVSIPFALMTVRELLTFKLNYDISSKCLLVLGFSVPSWVLLSCYHQLMNDNQNHRLNSFVVTFITVVNNIVGVYFFAASGMRISTKDDPFIPPCRIVILCTCDAIYSLINLSMDLRCNPGEDVSREQGISYGIATLFSTSIYITVALALASSYYAARSISESSARIINIDRICTILSAVAVFATVFSLTPAGVVYASPDISATLWSNFSRIKMAQLIYMSLFSQFVMGRFAKQKEKEALVIARQVAITESNSLRLLKEKDLINKVLCSLVPPKVAHDLSQGRAVEPEAFDFCAIFFSDIESFTPFCRKQNPLVVFDMLNRLYSVMDFCVSQFPLLYKVETIGDAYMVVAGILCDSTDGDDDDDANDNDGDDDDSSDTGCRSLNMGRGVGLGSSNSNSTNLLEKVESPRVLKCRTSSDTFRGMVCHDLCQFALLVNDCVQFVPMTRDDENPRTVRIRIGIHCGPAVTGLIGALTPRFCMFGDTVNIASRIESTGEAHRVHVSAKVHRLMSRSRQSKSYSFVSRTEKVDIKGAGPMQTYFLDSSLDMPIAATYAPVFQSVRQMIHSQLQEEANVISVDSCDSFLPSDFELTVVETPEKPLLRSSSIGKEIWSLNVEELGVSLTEKPILNSTEEITLKRTASSHGKSGVWSLPTISESESNFEI